MSGFDVFSVVALYHLNNQQQIISELRGVETKYASGVNKTKTAIIIMILVGALLTGGLIISALLTDKDFDDEHSVGKYCCPTCGSTDTSGGFTYWKNDGSLANNEAQADYTFFSCSDCGGTWKVNT